MARKSEAAPFRMVRATAQLRSLTPLSQSRYHGEKKNANETDDDFEERIWPFKLNCDTAGRVYIPPMALKKSLDSIAALLKERIPGKGNQEFKKQFICGVMVRQGLVLPLTREESIERDLKERLFVPPNGVAGEGKRVHRVFPKIPEWQGPVEYIVTSPAITEDVFHRYLKLAGTMVGLGRFRPERGGFYGQFEVLDFSWNVMNN